MDNVCRKCGRAVEWWSYDEKGDGDWYAGNDATCESDVTYDEVGDPVIGPHVPQYQPVVPTYLLIDTADGYTIWRDSDGSLFTRERVYRMADRRNAERDIRTGLRWVVAEVRLADPIG